MKRTRFKVLNSLRESCFATGKFCRKYKKDDIVAAFPGSLGIMVFDTYEHASEFAGFHLGDRCHTIISVKPIGRGARPTKIARHMDDESLKAFYKKGKPVREWDKMSAPPGTIAYPAVLTLE